MSANRKLMRQQLIAQAKQLRKRHRAAHAQPPIQNPTAASNKDYWDWIRSVAERRHTKGPLPDHLTVHPETAER